ncbi:MAG: Ig-like domain-containing protein [Myxococcales bacterium]
MDAGAADSSVEADASIDDAGVEDAGVDDAGVDDAGIDHDAGLNHGPQLAELADLTMVEGETRAITLSATDEDDDALTFALTAGPSWASLSDDTLTLAPTAGTAGEHNFTVEVSDGALSDSKSFKVIVELAAPVLSGLDQRAGTASGSPSVSPGAEVSALPFLHATVANLPSGEQVRLEAEVVLQSAAFSGTPSVRGELAAPGELLLALEPLRAGTYKWQMRAVDVAGNASDWLAFAQGGAAFTLLPQTLEGSLEIAGGADFTNSTSVSLAISATPAPGATLERMRFSTDGVAYTGWESFQATRAFLIAPATEGLKSIFVQLEDSLGNTGTFSDQITLDTTAPQGSLHQRGR